jgi:hypothetical protein
LVLSASWYGKSWTKQTGWSPVSRYQSLIFTLIFAGIWNVADFVESLKIVKPIRRSDYGILNCSGVFFFLFSFYSRVSRSRWRFGFVFSLVISFF